MAKSKRDEFYKWLLIVIAFTVIIGAMYSFHLWSKACGEDEMELKDYKKTTKRLVKDVREIKHNQEDLKRTMEEFISDDKVITHKKKLKGALNNG